jgi:hypothetical protein
LRQRRAIPMMSIMSSAAGAWWGLSAGAFSIVTGVLLLAVRPRRRQRTPGDRDLALTGLGMGMVMASTNATHVRNWSLTGKTVVFFCTVPIAIASLVFATRAMRAQRAAKRQETNTPAGP